jgi:hypothetical protein
MATMSRLRVTLPDEQMRQLRAYCKAQDRSIAGYVRQCLAKQMDDLRRQRAARRQPRRTDLF